MKKLNIITTRQEEYSLKHSTVVFLVTAYIRNYFYETSKEIFFTSKERKEYYYSEFKIMVYNIISIPIYVDEKKVNQPDIEGSIDLRLEELRRSIDLLSSLKAFHKDMFLNFLNSIQNLNDLQAYDIDKIAPRNDDNSPEVFTIDKFLKNERFITVAQFQSLLKNFEILVSETDEKYLIHDKKFALLILALLTIKTEENRKICWLRESDKFFNIDIFRFAMDHYLVQKTHKTYNNYLINGTDEEFYKEAFEEIESILKDNKSKKKY